MVRRGLSQPTQKDLPIGASDDIVDRDRGNWSAMARHEHLIDRHTKSSNRTYRLCLLVTFLHGRKACSRAQSKVSRPFSTARRPRPVNGEQDVKLQKFVKGIGCGASFCLLSEDAEQGIVTRTPGIRGAKIGNGTALNRGPLVIKWERRRE